MNNQLRQLRKNRNFTQEELAKKVKVTRNHISKIENGGAASMSVWFEIAKALDVKLSDIFLD
jgi:putative transcriptional regulator